MVAIWVESDLARWPKTHLWLDGETCCGMATEDSFTKDFWREVAILIPEAICLNCSRSCAYERYVASQRTLSEK